MRMLLTSPGEYFAEANRPPHVPETVAKAFYRPCKRKNLPASATKVISNDTCDHDDKVARVKPEELPPRVFRPPMLPNFLNKAPAEQGFINHVNDISVDHEPEREDQRDVHILRSSYRSLDMGMIPRIVGETSPLLSLSTLCSEQVPQASWL